MKPEVTRSSGNVFRDLGFRQEEAEHLKIRADLMVRLEKVIRSRGWTQKEAARRLGVTQPRISNLVRGRISLFSIDSLVEMLARAGVRVKLVMSEGRRKTRVA